MFPSNSLMLNVEISYAVILTQSIIVFYVHVPSAVYIRPRGASIKDVRTLGQGGG